MKTKWEFHFESDGIVFNKEHRFRGRAGDQEHDGQAGDGTDFEVELFPDRGPRSSGADDAGRFVVTLPGRPEENEGLACAIVLRLAEQIAFPHARLRILAGMVVATRIPETEEETNEVGDTPHLVKLQFEEVPVHPEFDPKQLTGASGPSLRYLPLLQQFNIAKQLESLTERFLGLFKVLEKAYADDRGVNLLKALQSSDELWELAQAVLTERGTTRPVADRQRFNQLLKKLVNIRGNCAHLRGRTGYSPGEPRVRTELEPHLELVAALAQACVDRHLRG
jgi:hypothetical protein